MHHNPLRLDLQRVLGRELPDRVWDHLEERALVVEYQDGEMSLFDLCKEAISALSLLEGKGATQKAVQAVVGQGDEPSIEEDAHQQRIWTISVLVAEEAREDLDVRSFRKDVLGGKLLDPKEVRDWVRDRADSDGPPTEWLTDLPVPRGHKRIVSRRTYRTYTEPPLTLGEDNGARGGAVHLLEYSGPDDRWVQQQPVAAGSALDRLRDISERLERTFTWQRAQATAFVLTDQVPLIDDLRVRAELKFPLQSLTRVVLTVDPTVTPARLTEVYRMVRNQALKGRHRSLTTKHYRLAAFFGESAQDETWRSRMGRWNLLWAGQGWAYDQVGYFRRDCMQAVERILRPKYELLPVKHSTGGE